MTAIEKYNVEKDELKLARMNRILSSAFILFSQKGIDTIAMTDIAKSAEIGVASLYRYYETKDEIAIRTAIWAWENQQKKLIPELTSDEYKNKSGIEQMEEIFRMFIQLYEKEKDFLRFIYFFDSYAVRSEIPQERLIDYEKMIMSVQQIVKEAISKGLEDKSIKEEYKNSEDTLYFTLMHTMFSAAQKLCLSGELLDMDSVVSGKAELETLSKIIILGIRR